MTVEELIQRGILKELNYTFSKSSGPGGQNVNKVNSRAELRFNIHGSSCLGVEEKALLFSKLKNRISSEGDLILLSSESRSQVVNREDVTERFLLMISKAITPARKRKVPVPGPAAREKRLEDKKIRSERKQNRKSPDI